MAGAKSCPICGTELRAGDPEGPCPACRTPDTPADGDGAPGDPLATLDHTPSNPAGEATGEWSDVPTRTPETPIPPSPLARGTAVRYFGDYEVVRELGRGGMGVVYEARQVSLNRPVALKLIKAGLLADDAELLRFQNEAEAVALLDHPGIVSAYEVGEHDGQQYLAMKLIRGDSLSSSLAKYRDDPRAAASLVAEAAEAVAHAHSRGILHRDLKPANILVDADGHPHITDFGLAKRLESDIEMTASGAILGTPAYMAPEQATGRRGGITTATDIYGLGAVLYALLTGRAPFAGDTVIETLDALRTMPPAPPMLINIRVPGDLETICLKCLEKDPRRRYASAQALADDLRAWLDSRPIAARRVGPAERAWLWCKRRPAVAALAAAVATAIVGGTAATIAVQLRANRALLEKNKELGLAYGREAEANERVQQRYNLAMDAIKTFHKGVSEDFLLKEPAFRSLREKLLNSAGEFYDKLGRAMEGSQDAASLQALYASNFELAGLEKKLGRREDALALHRRVLEGREALAAEPGAPPEAKLDAARSLREVISLLKEVGKKDEVPPLQEKALAYHERLAAEFPGDPGVQDALASMFLLVGDQFKNVDERPKEAEEYFRRGLAIWEELTRSHPDEPKYAAGLANAHAYLSFLRVDDGKYDEAIRLYRPVVEMAQQDVDRDPKDVSKRIKLIAALGTSAGWYNSARRYVEAIEPATAAVASWREIVAEQPAVPGHRHNLASSLYGLAQALMQSGRPAQAEPRYREATAILDGLAEEQPGDRKLRQGRTDYRNALAFALQGLNRKAEAEAEFRAVLEAQEGLSAEEPENHDLLDSIAITHLNLGRLTMSEGRMGESEREFLAAIAILERISREHPALAIYRIRLSGCHRHFAEMLALAGRLPEAEAQYQEAMAGFRRQAEETPDAPWVRNDIATMENNLGDILREQGRASEALDGYERAVAIRERLVEEEPSTALYRSHLAWSLRRRALVRREQGDIAGASADIGKVVEIWDGQPAKDASEWFESACAHAQRSALAGQEGSGVEADAAGPEAQQTLECARKAFDGGFRVPRLYRREKALNPLRDRPEFQRLMMDIEPPAEPADR
ncbi:MAG: serine/threonine-protein kinase [Isosphaeraceae bacterium]